MSDPSVPSPEEAELAQAASELEAALDALRRAQALWVGARPWAGAKTWDMATARRALEEAESRLHAARTRLSLALAMARRRELTNGAQD